jgi:hypothetical protein
MSVLAPFVSRAAEDFIRATSEAAYEKARELLQTLRTRWSGDKEASDDLERFVERPERYAPVLGDLLEEKLAEDPSLAATLKRLLDELGPTLLVVQELDEAKRVLGLDVKEMRSGTATVEQRIGKGEDITGGRFGSVG